MAKQKEARGLDIPILQLQPMNQRKVKESGFKKILASLKVIGLIEPLCVFKDGDRYLILDGYLRYLACMDLGIETVPCLVYKNKEVYTFNRMVNRLSPVQEHRMLKRSLETLDEKTIANAFGLASPSNQLKTSLLQKLHADALKAYDAGNITRACAEALTFVKPERQAAILRDMKRTGDFSPAFARALVIRTPATLRNKASGKRKKTWSQEEKKKALYTKLGEVEQRYDFYSGLYRQYVADLLKLCVYARRLITNERTSAYLQANHPDVLKLFTSIIF